MEQSFDRPIPGMGMTFEVGSRPWQTPPEITTVEQATKAVQALDRIFKRFQNTKLLYSIFIPMTS